jgi:hypothetical protein
VLSFYVSIGISLLQKTKNVSNGNKKPVSAAKKEVSESESDSSDDVVLSLKFLYFLVTNFVAYT